MWSSPHARLLGPGRWLSLRVVCAPSQPQAGVQLFLWALWAFHSLLPKECPPLDVSPPKLMPFGEPTGSPVKETHHLKIKWMLTFILKTFLM